MAAVACSDPFRVNSRTEPNSLALDAGKRECLQYGRFKVVCGAAADTFAGCCVAARRSEKSRFRNSGAELLKSSKAMGGFGVDFLWLFGKRPWAAGDAAEDFLPLLRQ